MPQPETTSAAPVLVVIAARWISPRSTVARFLLKACSAYAASSNQNRGSFDNESALLVGVTRRAHAMLLLDTPPLRQP